MFKKFGKEEISGFTQVKASVARGIRCEMDVSTDYLHAVQGADAVVLCLQPV